MKKALLLLVFVTACSTKPETFTGFGNLKVGTKFQDLAKARDFELLFPGQVFARDYTLPNGIGSVSDVSVSTVNDTISRVRFSTNKQTNLQALISGLADLKELDPPMKVNIGNSKIYCTPDANVFLAVEEKTASGHGGIIHYEYAYYTKEALSTMVKDFHGSAVQ
ncbi:MAG: hypothetical protein EOO51_08215 [Flavobacterium sp.]|nr:MAG: hypothetical protein EOO51_08215 [Flavobacterium sp.]